MLEDAVAQIFAKRVHTVRQLVACRSAANRLARIGKAGKSRQFFMRGLAGDRFTGTGKGCEPGCKIDTGAVDVDAVAPRGGSVDPCTKPEVLIFGTPRVLNSDTPVHVGRGIDGVRHRLEADHQPVSEAFHEAAAITRQNLARGKLDEVCPPMHGGRLMLPHQPHRLDEIDQEDHCVLLHEAHAGLSEPGLS
ncbi:hypothetical protein [Bradyrhizobium liaoningense]